MTKISADIRNLSILTLITVAVWIGYEIYSVYNNPSIPDDYQKLVQPIDLQLDTEFLKSLTVKSS